MSVNFLKVKNRSTARALMKHCDKTERIKNNHSNEDIDKAETNNNLQLYNESLEESMNRFTNRIAMLDATTNTNKRKDRVELFSLDIPIPHGIPEKEFFNEVCNAFKRAYGEQNVINMYLHTDEQHTYIDSSLTARTSMSHIHAFIVPELHTGKLCAKEFSSKSRMQSVNKALDNFCRKTYGIPFLTGEKTKSRAKVEDLKKSSSEVTEELFAKLREETPVNASKTITGDIKLKKEDFDTLIAKSTAYDMAEKRKEALTTEVSAAEKVLKEKEATINEITSLKSEAAELNDEIDTLLEKKARLGKYKDTKAMEALEESAELFDEVQKLKKEKSALIEALEDIQKKIKIPTIQNIIQKALDSVREKQAPERQKAQNHEQTL